MRNDLSKYWSEDFKKDLSKLKKKTAMYIAMCAFIILTYFFDRNIIHLILAILSGILGIAFIITMVGLYTNPTEMVKASKPNVNKNKNKKKKRKK